MQALSHHYPLQKSPQQHHLFDKSQRFFGKVHYLHPQNALRLHFGMRRLMLLDYLYRRKLHLMVLAQRLMHVLS